MPPKIRVTNPLYERVFDCETYALLNKSIEYGPNKAGQLGRAKKHLTHLFGYKTEWDGEPSLRAFDFLRRFTKACNANAVSEGMAFYTLQDFTAEPLRSTIMSIMPRASTGDAGEVSSSLELVNWLLRSCVDEDALASQVEEFSQASQREGEEELSFAERVRALRNLCGFIHPQSVVKSRFVEDLSWAVRTEVRERNTPSVALTELARFAQRRGEAFRKTQELHRRERQAFVVEVLFGKAKAPPLAGGGGGGASKCAAVLVDEALKRPGIGVVIVVGSPAMSTGTDFPQMVWALFIGGRNLMTFAQASGRLCRTPSLTGTAVVWNPVGYSSAIKTADTQERVPGLALLGDFGEWAILPPTRCRRNGLDAVLDGTTEANFVSCIDGGFARCDFGESRTAAPPPPSRKRGRTDGGGGGGGDARTPPRPPPPPPSAGGGGGGRWRPLGQPAQGRPWFNRPMGPPMSAGFRPPRRGDLGGDGPGGQQQQQQPAERRPPPPSPLPDEVDWDDMYICSWCATRTASAGWATATLPWPPPRRRDRSSRNVD